MQNPNHLWWNNDNIEVNGEPVSFDENLERMSYTQEYWDKHFLRVAKRYADMSKCASRQIGAVIVNDGYIVGDGVNGAPCGVVLCQTKKSCPRRKLQFPSGEGMNVCPAVHAEVNACLKAGREKAKGGTMYCWCGVPCKDCTGAIINVGIKRLVCLKSDIVYQQGYGDLGRYMFEQAGVEIVEFDEKEVLDGND